MNCKEGIASGSARSIEGINIIQAIQENSRNLIKFGGHPMAAGLSISVEKIPEFRDGLSKSIFKMSTGLIFEKLLEIDAYLPLVNINESLLLETERMAPFGPGNPPPVLVSKNLEIEKTGFIGKSKEHRKLIIKDQHGNFKNALWWDSADFALPGSLFDLAYYVRRDDYHSNGEISLEWLDFREIEELSITLPSISIKYKINDYRTTPNPVEILEGLANKPDVTFWAEGIKLDQFPICNRIEIRNTHSLVFLVSPPDRSVLKEVVEKSNPTEIFFFNLSPINDTFRAFINRLIGLVKYCLLHKGGKTTIAQLGSALGQSNKTILGGLEFLAAKGEIEFGTKGNDIEIRRAYKVKSTNAEDFEEKLRFFLKRLPLSNPILCVLIRVIF